MNPAPVSSDQTPAADQARWFVEEVQPHEVALRGYLRTQFPSIDTDDVAQESYLKLLKARPATRIASVKAFLSRHPRPLNPRCPPPPRALLSALSPIAPMTGWMR